MITNYTITTWDNQVYTIDAKNGEKLIDAWTGADKPFPVDLGGVAISSSAIKGITPNRVTEADWIDPAREKMKKLEAGSRCRGQYSIQNEINKLAQDTEYWQHYIQNNTWREKTRKQLRETGADWCDYKAGECACEPGFLSVKSTFERMV